MIHISTNMSYNGIGLSTVRGSGTSGYVQSNSANRGVYRSGKYEHRREEEEKARYNENKLKLTSVSDRNVDLDLVDHEKKRRIEVKVFELQVELEDQGLPQEEIEERTSELRLKLQADEKRKLSRYDPALELKEKKRHDYEVKNVHVDSSRKAQMNEHWENGSRNIRRKGHDDRENRDYHRNNRSSRRFDDRDRRYNSRSRYDDDNQARRGSESRLWERKRSPERSNSRSRSPPYREHRSAQSDSSDRVPGGSREIRRRRPSFDQRDTSDYEGDPEGTSSSQTKPRSRNELRGSDYRGGSSGRPAYNARDQPPVDSRRDSRPLRPYE